VFQRQGNKKLGFREGWVRMALFFFGFLPLQEGKGGEGRGAKKKSTDKPVPVPLELSIFVMPCLFIEGVCVYLALRGFERKAYFVHYCR